ncbi:substrate-binding domain-containing protein [Mycetohabitans endofungorum]|uniref:substrate-binding domain-containing protein n=1 Tax=Mycetohabitans endofungorum TaxID=417203 RepID=UPI003BAE3799
MKAPRIEAVSELRIVADDHTSVRLSDVILLLTRLVELGSIASAAQALGLSYRHAWGMLRTAEQRLGGPLLVKVRGQGSLLSPLGEKLLWAERVRIERLGPLAQSLGVEVTDEIQRLLASARHDVRIHASHGYAVAALVQALAEGGTSVEIRYRDSADAVASLSRGECDLAGFHLPIGPFRAVCAAVYRPWLDDKRHVLIHLARRKQGLFVPKGNPEHIGGLADLSREGLRFVNRQPGSGTRMLLDLMLRDIGIDPTRIDGYASTELTHSAIAAFVASGKADVGFGVQPAAAYFGLDFVPIVDEDYYFACERAALDVAPLLAIVDELRGDAFKGAVARLHGYDAARCGDCVPIQEGVGSQHSIRFPDY